MGKSALWIGVLLALVMGFVWAEDKPEMLPAVNDISPLQAYQMLIAEPDGTFLIDVRSMAEYEFVGHPPAAYNIPYKFWEPEGMKSNANFAQDVAEKFKKTDKLILICRSGKRSQLAGFMLLDVGFMQVFNLAGGFEGDKVTDLDSPNYGQRRLVNGWQHDNLPYTYKLEKKFAYKLHTSCGCD